MEGLSTDALWLKRVGLPYESETRVRFMGRVKAHLDQRVYNLEEVEFFKIGIGGVKSPHPVLPQDCCNVCVGHQIPVNAGRLGHLRIVRSERIGFLNDARPRKAKQFLELLAPLPG